MIKIKKAGLANIEVLALLGRITYVESHSHFIEDKGDLAQYINQAFSVTKTKQDLSDPQNLYFIIHVNDLPVGYAKVILNALHESVDSQNTCCLDKIYVLQEFIPLKVGQQLLTHVEEQARELLLDTMWLCVYIKNNRAIRFYQKNNFDNVGSLDFLVNEKEYENIVFSKKL